MDELRGYSNKCKCGGIIEKSLYITPKHRRIYICFSCGQGYVLKLKPRRYEKTNFVLKGSRIKKTKPVHKLTMMEYNGKRVYDRGKNGYGIASWKCPVCDRTCECGMPKDKNTLIVNCDGT